MRLQTFFSVCAVSGLLGMSIDTPAWAGTCAAIVEAFKKADKEDRMGTLIKGGGFLNGFDQDGEKRIGKVKCMPPTATVAVYSCEEAKDPDFLSPVGKGRAHLYLAGDNDGEYKCRSLGTDKIDGEMVDKYELNMMGLTEVFWISTKTGLPLAQDSGLTVMKYSYGAAVKDCDCKKK